MCVGGGRVCRRIQVSSLKRNGAGRYGVGVEGQLGGEFVLFEFGLLQSLGLGASILEPNFDLYFGQAE